MASARRNKPEQLAALEDFTNALGRQFQVRDDYMNLVSGEVSCLAPPPPEKKKPQVRSGTKGVSSPQYTDMKGFCEDLDEGKYSVPLIHVLKTQPQNYQLLNLLATGHKQGYMTREMKELVLAMLEAAGSLQYMRSVLEDLQADVQKSLAKLQDLFGSSNPELALMVELLKV